MYLVQWEGINGTFRHGGNQSQLQFLGGGGGGVFVTLQKKSLQKTLLKLSRLLTDSRATYL